MTADGECLVTQQTFRTILQAMSHPGRIYPLSRAQKEKNRPTAAEGLTMILRTLLDHEVSFRVIGADQEDMAASIARRTGCPLAEISAADFLVVFGGASDGAILQAKRGTLAYPDDGATVIYAVESLEGAAVGETAAAGSTVSSAVLRGPGIKDELAVAVSGLNPDELVDIRECTSEFPVGIDCIFVDRANRVMSIPRSTRIEVK
jgi:alpha-D-ribose 1-methylphosphonate 5-triphosphate synthase subunit PhnH